MPNNPISNPSRQLYVTSSLYGGDEDMTKVSRSKLDHIKYMASDDRLQEPAWNVDRSFGSISAGLFFTALGALFQFSSLPDYGKVLCLIGLCMGLFFSIYAFVREYRSHKKTASHRTDLVNKIQEMIDEMDKVRALNTPPAP